MAFNGSIVSPANAKVVNLKNSRLPIPIFEVSELIAHNEQVFAKAGK